jgi:opacity protein-like surface antigen
MKKDVLPVFLGFIMLFATSGVSAQNIEVSPWGYGLATSFGLTAENGIPDSYSLSFHGWHREGGGMSIDWISQRLTSQGHNYELTGSRNGILGSIFMGIPVGNVFRPYIGGGLGVGFDLGDAGNSGTFFAWKLDAGMLAWLTDAFFIKTGYSFDNIRQHSVSVGVGFRLRKNVTGRYRNADGTTFERTWTRFIWESSRTPESIFSDTFSHSEIIDRFQRTTIYHTTGIRRVRGRTSVLGGGMVGNPGSGGELIAHFSVYEITVTREWFRRTWYYQTRSPRTEIVFRDVESVILVDYHMRQVH